MIDSPATGYAKTTDSSIYYEQIGTDIGVPLLLLHGGPGFNHKTFKVSSIWPELGNARPIIFYDQRGTGKSSIIEIDDPCTLADQLRDIEALRKHLKHDQIDLLGHSWGGFLGMAYTAKYPEQVRRLTLVDSAPPQLNEIVVFFEHFFPELVAKQNEVASAMEMGDEEARLSYIKHYLAMLCYSTEKRDVWLSQVDPKDFRFHVNQKVVQDARRFDLNPEVKKFQQPTLVITGRYDINASPSISYKIYKSIPNSRFEVFEKSGHLPFFEEPDKFLQVVDDFLSAT